MQAKGRLQCWNADGQRAWWQLPRGGSCREGCAGKGQAATLEQQRLPARGRGGSCLECPNERGLCARKSSTPAVVPGAAPALAKAGVGGFYSNVACYIKTNGVALYCITACFIQFILYHVILYYFMSRHAKSHTLVNYILY